MGENEERGGRARKGWRAKGRESDGRSTGNEDGRERDSTVVKGKGLYSSKLTAASAYVSK